MTAEGITADDGDTERIVNCNICQSQYYYLKWTLNFRICDRYIYIGDRNISVIVLFA